MTGGDSVAAEPPLVRGLSGQLPQPDTARTPEGAHTLFRATLSYLPGRVIPAAAAALTIPIVAAQLEPAAFGTFALVAAALPFVAVVTAEWVIAGHQRYAHRERSPQASLWVIILSTAAALSLAAAWLISRQSAVLALALLLPPFLILRLQSIDLQMTGRAKRYSAQNCTYSVLRGTLVVLAAYTTGELAWVFAGWIAASSLTVLVGPRLPIRGHPSLSALRTLGRIGVPLVAAGMSLNVSATADRFIIAAIEGRAQTGVYTFGYMIGEAVVALPLTLPFLAAQYMATRRWDHGDQEGTIRFLRKVVLVQTAVGMVVVLGLSLSAGTIFGAFGPDKYASAEQVLVIVGSAQLVAGVAPYLLVLATLRKETRRVIAPCVLTAAASVVLTVAAVASAGIVGAALATAATYVLQLMLLQRAVKTTLLDPLSTSLVLGFAVATFGAIPTGPLRVPLVVLMAAASVAQCSRAFRSVLIPESKRRSFGRG